MSRTVRAFLALEIPGPLKATLKSSRDRIQDALPPARWTRPEGWHLTLKFLGDADEETLEALISKLAPRVAGLGSVAADLQGGGFFPSPAKPRVAWVGGSLEGAPPLIEAVEKSAEQVGYSRERRPWRVHLTVARLKSRWPSVAVDRFLAWADGLRGLSFASPEVVLFESDLQPMGAVYTALERIPLE